MNDLPIGTILVNSVSKRYSLGALGTLRGALAALVNRGRNGDAPQDFWALKDVNFRVDRGDSLGLIGPNGSGKTTTLKLLSNITRPTAGNIATSGRVSSLIELGAGFHPELTGRENIFLNGAILGLSRREIQRKLDEIIAFSELERFIDTPVKRYSSGMYVRLGFAVAAHVEPDILLVDEVLAVGDASFRHRCITHMRELRRKGTTIIFVSHNMHLVRDMCSSALLLVDGQIQVTGNTDTVISQYEKSLLTPKLYQSELATSSSAGVAINHGQIVLTSIEVLPSLLDTGNEFASNHDASVRIHYQTGSPQNIGRIDVRMMRDDGTLCSALDSLGPSGRDDRFREISGSGIIDVLYRPLQLTTGRYYVIVRITDQSDSLVIASGQSPVFQVYETYSVPEPGLYVPQVSWIEHNPE
jgi:lipopolysaccharide transport system ATP-binding protein